jgi:hypothetical protein
MDRGSEQAPQLLDGHAGVSQNAAERALGEVPPSVDRHGRSTSVGMTHDPMASGDPNDLEPRSFQRSDDPVTGHRGRRGH